MSSISKRLWALMLAASMVFSMMAMSVSATEQETSTEEMPSVSVDVPEANTEGSEVSTTPTEETTDVSTEATETTESTEATEDGAQTEETEGFLTGIAGIELIPLTMYPETGGQWITENGASFYRYNWEYHIAWYVHFEDGTQEYLRELIYGEFLIGNDLYCMETEDTQDAQHWEPGNSYDVTVRLKNLTQGTEFSDTTQVTVSEESPLLSFTVDPITVYAGQNRVLSEEGYLYYDLRDQIRFSAEFTSGQVIDKEQDTSFYYEEDGCRYAFNIGSDQSADNIWEPGEHTLQVSVMGKTVDVPVTILESPVTSLTVEPVTIVENQKGGLSSTVVDDQYVEYFHYCWYWDMHYQITFADGSVENYTHSSGFSYNDTWYELSHEDNQETERWTAGNTYTVTVSAFGAETEVSVQVVANPVSAIVMDPVTVYKGMDDYEEYDWVYDEESGTESQVLYRGYRWYEDLGFTVYYTDGESEHVTGSQLDYAGVIYNLNYYDGQGYNNQWEAGKTYTFQTTFMGVESTQIVEVKDSPVQSVTYEPITITEGTNGYVTENENGEYYFYHWYNELSYTVTFQDGTSATGNSNGFTYQDNWYYISYGNPQEEEPWQVGTYMVDVAVMGIPGQVQVTIEASPLERIEIQPITIVEGTCGYTDTYYDPETDSDVEYYYYSWYDELKYTLYFTGSEPVTGTGTSYYYNDQWYYFYWINEQYGSPWSAGNSYQTEVTFMGKKATVDVSIKESTLQNITLTPVTMLENTGGWTNTDEGFEDPAMNGSYYYYNWAGKMQATLTFTDQVFTVAVNQGFEYDGKTYSLSYTNDQNYANRWLPGSTHTVTVDFMGQTAQSQVTITPLNVKSITVQPITLREYTDGYYGSSWVDGSWENYFHYTWYNELNYQVEMADGTVYPGSGQSFNYLGNNVYLSYQDPQSAANPWYAGCTYELSVSLADVSVPVYVTIASVQSEDGWEYMVQNDMAFITNCYSYSDIINVPDTLGGYPVKGINSLGNASYYVNYLHIPDSVTMINEYLFSGEQGFESLRGITFGSGISNLTMDMFRKCINLESISVSELNENYFSEDGVVYDKGMTTVVVFPQAKTGTYYLPESVTNADVIFDNLGQLQAKIEFTQVDGYMKEDGVVYNEDKTVLYFVEKDKTGDYVMPDSVAEIKRLAFSGSNLSSVTVSESVTDIVYYTFYESAIQNVTLPDSVTTIEIGAFEDCGNLTSVNMPAALEVLGAKAFANTGLTSVELPATLTRVSDMTFFGSSLQQVVLPEGLQSIGEYAFAQTDLTQVTIPDSVTYMGDSAFARCFDLSNVTLGNGLESIPTDAFSNTAIRTLTVPDSVRNISSCAFDNCYQLSQVTLGKNVQGVGYYAFRGCPITQLELGESLMYINDCAFCGADLQTLELPQTVTNICYMAFGDNINLQNITLPDSVTWIDHAAFANTGWYNAQPEGHVYLDGFYYEYKGAMPVGTVLYLPADIRGIANEAVTYSSLDGVIFTGDAPARTYPSNTTVFYPADNETWTEDVVSNMGNNAKMVAVTASGQCGENAYWVLTQEGQLQIIGYGAMYDYTEGNTPWQAYNQEISSVRVSGRITYVGSYAFAGCDASTVTFESDAPTFGQNVFASMTATVNYPTYCQGWDTVVTSQYGGVITWHLMNDVYASGACGITANWSLDASGTLTVFGSGYMSWSDWGGNSDMVKRIIIEEGVQSVYDGSFQNMYNLDKVVIASSVEYIGTYAFANCTSLKQVTIPADGAMYRIGSEAFCNCSSLESIELPNGLEKVEYRVFANCASLTNVTLPEGLNGMEWSAFENCDKLTSVTIPDGVTEMGGAVFMNCVSLSYVHLPMSVNELGYEVFRNCINLKSIELPQQLVSMEGTFWGSGIQSITIPATVTRVGPSTFRECVELTQVTFTGPKPAIESNAFKGVTATVYYPGEDESWQGVENGYYGGNLTWVPVFDYVDEGECGESLTWHLKSDGTLIIKGTGEMYDYGAYGAPWSPYLEQIIDVQMDGVTYVGDHAFYDCSELRRISAESLTGTGEGAFEKCTSLWSAGFENLESLGRYAFAGCLQLRDFYFNPALQSIGDYAFQGCASLHSVYFNGTPELGKYVFQGCTGLKLADIGYSTYVSEGMFAGCVELDTVYMSREVTSIGEAAFMNCEELDSITLGKNVSYIGDFAFFGCSSLNSLQLPDSVTYVGSYAMHNCENLQTVVFQGDAPEFGYQPLSNVTANVTYFSNTNGWSDELISSLGGTLNVSSAEKTYVSLFRNGNYMAAYVTMEEALAEYNSATDYLRVSYGMELNISLNQDLYLDLNGNDLTGVICTNGYKIYGVDTTTDTYYWDAMGYMSCTDENGELVSVEKITHVQEAVFGKTARYMAVETSNGWTFHRFYIGITHTSLKPANTGIGFKAVFYGDEMVISQLDSIGYALQLDGSKKMTYWKDANQILSGEQVSLRVQNWDIARHGETALYAQVCLQLWDGTMVETGIYETSMREQLEDINDSYTAYDDVQLSAVCGLISANPVTRSWDIGNLLNILVEQQINAAYALGVGESLDAPATLTGVITQVNYVYNSEYQNITVTFAVEGYEDKPIMCYRLKGDGADQIGIGDTITVTGILTNYNGTVEFNVGCTLDAWQDTGVEEELTPVEIVNAAYALGEGESLNAPATLTGVITMINTAYNSSYMNITVTIAVEGVEDKPIMCYRLKGDGADQIGIGDTITVTGTLKNYSGTIEFIGGCTLDAWENTGTDVEKLTDPIEIVNAAYALTVDEALPYEVTLTGTITSVDTAYSTSYGNVTVTIAIEGVEDKPIQCFRLKGTGADTIGVGDTITVTGTIKNYNGKIQFVAGCTLG